jgi:ornithine cyclodeaminase/alanine dehydrogenase-like protein (mu-crystallin family)
MRSTTIPDSVADDEIVVFDSTATGLQDVAAAITTYRQALDAHAGMHFTFLRRAP